MHANLYVAHWVHKCVLVSSSSVPLWRRHLLSEMATFAVRTQRWFIILDDRGVVYYYGEVVYQTKISSAWKVLLPWLLTFLSPRKEQRACATSGLWLVSEALPPKSPFFLLPSPPPFNCSVLRCQWTVYAYMKERGLSTCYKIKLTLCTPGLFVTTDDHEGFNLVWLIDRTQELAVSRTQHLLFYYSS